MPAAISINWIDECQVAGEKIFELFVKFARSTKFVLDVRFFADIIFNVFLFKKREKNVNPYICQHVFCNLHHHCGCRRDGIR